MNWADWHSLNKIGNKCERWIFELTRKRTVHNVSDECVWIALGGHSHSESASLLVRQGQFPPSAIVCVDRWCNVFDHSSDIFLLKDLLLLRATSTEGRDVVRLFLEILRRLDLSSSAYSKFTVEAFQVESDFHWSRPNLARPSSPFRITHSDMSSQVVTVSRNIRHLNLRGCSLRWLQDSVVVPTLISNPLLSFLDLSSCHGLTEGVIFALSTSDCAKQLKSTSHIER